MSEQSTTAYNTDEMAVLPAVVRASVDQLAGRARAAPGDPDAGFSTATAAAAMFAVSEAMRVFTAETTLVADNMTAAGSVYESTDDAVRAAVDDVRRSGR